MSVYRTQGKREEYVEVTMNGSTLKYVTFGTLALAVIIAGYATFTHHETVAAETERAKLNLSEQGQVVSTARAAEAKAKAEEAKSLENKAMFEAMHRGTSCK